MAIEKTEWGATIEKFNPWRRVGNRLIITEGTNEIKPHGFIPLHKHENEAEQYRALSKGLKVIVIKDAEGLSDEDVKKLLEKQPSLHFDQRVTCPKGYFHAMYNSEATPGYFVFSKFFGD